MDKTKSKEYKCNFCANVYVKKAELMMHKKIHIEDKLFHCKICHNVHFEFEHQYLLHVKEVHNGKSVDYFRCNDCGKEYRTKNELTKHIKSKCGTLKQWKCELCEKQLMSAGSLHNHLRKHRDDRRHMCKFCAKLFLTLGQLEVHERSHTQNKPFICNICGKGFSHRQSLITHNTLHTGIKPYSCENCKKSFSCIGNLMKHRKTHADTCGLISTNAHLVNNPDTKMKLKYNTPANTKLKTNLKAELKQIDNSETKIETKAVLKCDLTNQLDQEIHYKETVNEDCHEVELNETNEDVSVSNITKIKITKEELQQFMLERGYKNEDKGHTTYNCIHCSKTFQTPAWLMKHEIQHSKNVINKSIKCSCCKQIFATKEECIKHQELDHTDILTCQFCDKIFSSRDSLTHHKKILHLGYMRKVYLYVCQKCGIQFKERSLLQQHENNNCTEPSIECEICKKLFKHQHVKIAHMRVHTSEKKFLCNYCGKSYHWKGQLQIHERSHTGEKPYSCLYCPKTFNYRESLLTHSTLHTGIKPYFCEACGSRFSCIGNLKKHHFTHASTCMSWCMKNKSDGTKYKWLNS